MTKHTLPFTLNVEMRTYHNKSFPLGIIKSHIPGYDIWLCNKLINCTMRADGDFDSYEQDIWSEKDGLTKTQATDLNDLVAEGKMFDIVNRNREMLKVGVYITGTYNEYFIPGKSAYKRNDFRHDYVIFGYDDAKRVFNSAAYFPDGSYRFYEMDYDAYYDSIVKREVQGPLYVCYREINKEYIPTIKIEHIKAELRNYLYSREDNEATESQDFFGLEAWNKLPEYVQSREGIKLDNRYARIFMEHRQLMGHRIKKLYELGYLSDAYFDEYNDKVCIPAQAVHYLFIKYNLTHDSKVSFQIIENIKRANANEAEIISKIVEAVC